MKKVSLLGCALLIINARLEAAELPVPSESGIKHVVVVMMENRSFNHLLGWVPGANGRQSGLTYTNTNNVAIATFPLAPDFQGCGHPDPDHSYAGGRVEYNNGACDGWLRAGQNDEFAIGYYTQPDLPFLGVAATNWTVCDNYFSSIMAGTFPNRIYQHSAQTDRLSNTLAICDLPTIWDRLKDKGLTGRYYFSDVPMLALWGRKHISIMRPISKFYEDAAAGKLPEVSFVEPRFLGEAQGVSGDYHPFGHIHTAEHFLSKVYTAVINSPNWTNTVMVINFDEWGGFFDHVPPPTRPVPDADRAAADSSGLLGFRIPALIISPWSHNKIATNVFDHTSVLKMIEWRWDLDPLTIRDETAVNLAEALDFAAYNPAAIPINAPEVISLPCAIQEPVLTFTGSNVVLRWVADARLQLSTNLFGEWIDAIDAKNGFTVSTTESAQYFRIYNKFDRLYQLAKSLNIQIP